MLLTKEEREKFDAYMTELASLDPTKGTDPAKPVTDPGGPDDEQPAAADLDAELEALLNDALADDKTPAPVGGPELSAESRQAIELANARSEQIANENAAIRDELDASRFEAEKQVLLSKGVPPVMVDLAMPLLLGKSHLIELSNSTKVDAGEIVRGLLKEAEGTVDLSGETTPAPNSPAGDKTGALLDTWEKQFPALTK
jgi:hypothetical protein